MRHNSKVQSIYPALAEAQAWLHGHSEPMPLKQRLEIPVLCLRWTQASTNRKMMFGHDGVDDDSVYKLVDQLQRGDRTTGSIDKMLDVAAKERT